MGFDPVAEMAGKIAYAKRRWGCTLFYVDTNVTLALAGNGAGKKEQVDDWFVRAEQMRRLARQFPDVLIIPEFQYTGYYSHLSGYRELRGGIASTSPRDRLAYPGQFSVINVADGPIVERRADLLDAVRPGDILMFRGWFGTRKRAGAGDLRRGAAELKRERKERLFAAPGAARRALICLAIVFAKCVA